MLSMCDMTMVCLRKIWLCELINVLSTILHVAPHFWLCISSEWVYFNDVRG